MRAKIKALTFILVFLLLVKTVSAETATLKASTAHIYHNQAILTIPLMNLDTSKIFLPSTVDEKSIRLATTGDKEIINYSIEKLPVSNWSPPALYDLANIIEKDKKTLSAMELNINSLNMAIVQLGEIKPELAPEKVPEYVNTIMDSKKVLNIERLKEQNKINIMTEKIKDNETLLKEQTAGTAGKVIKLSIKSKGKGDLYLICRTKYAGWSRSYRLNLNSSNNSLLATLKGKVFQKSGIDLDGDIILHHGNPDNRIYTPNVKALTVGTLKTEVRSNSYKMETAMMRDTIEPLMPRKKMVKETLTDKTIHFKGTITGNGVKNNVSIEKWEDIAETSILAIPYMSTKAWLMVSIDNIKTPIVSAPAEIYVDGSYSGISSMKKRVRGQNLNMAFAFVPEIGIERKKIIPKNKSNWIGKGTLKEGYSITLTNGLNKKIKLKVKDRVPVSVESVISVKNMDINPSFTSFNDKKGILTWRFSLNPGEQKKINVIYEIKYPSDTELSFSGR